MERKYYLRVAGLSGKEECECTYCLRVDGLRERKDYLRVVGLSGEEEYGVQILS